MSGTGTDSTASPATTADRLDTGRPHPARMYDWFLGGKDNYPVDEELGRQLLRLQPEIMRFARHNRRFMERAVRRLADEGVRQFLDIGSGIPTEPNLHQIAQSTAPDACVVYVDNDPIVLAHSGALLRGTEEGVTRYLDADVREPDRLLELAAGTIDFTRPVALSLVALTHFIPDRDQIHDLVGRYVGALAPGSHLVLSQATGDFDPEAVAAGVAAYAARGATFAPRTHAEVSRFFDGLELLDPGVVPVGDWHPETHADTPPTGAGPVPIYAGVARKP
ncbi:SAM-dependent methyltransferase [Streptomyces sp. NBC_01754]|uniref:SAM-dependent methyltransferase n=1 Tax=Streptomyces sp. NBC_01754 TaxID=2975930 RepID=UPI002DDA2E27|nr:SAM-dependent methyltransferase [Streptomyces sp. NBC_01754]WSC95991.1 SAM-dependent methyltransferase [Streptomyces sp. NBC_01754]